MTYSKYGVSAQKEKELAEKMEKLGIKESDICERFIRARGPGGQNVNKTSTCVHLKHLPTNIEVKCQRERSQSLNRFFARRILAKKIENIILGKKSEEKKRIEKIKRQKRKRSKRAKEKIRKLKEIRSEKKRLRGSKLEIEG
jgi:protein subunit release factor B